MRLGSRCCAQRAQAHEDRGAGQRTQDEIDDPLVLLSPAARFDHEEESGRPHSERDEGRVGVDREREAEEVLERGEHDHTHRSSQKPSQNGIMIAAPAAITMR